MSGIFEPGRVSQSDLGEISPVGANTALPSQQVTTQDEISASEEVAATSAVQASQPNLIPPSENHTSGEAIAISFELKKAAIANSVLDSWIESLEEQKELVRQKLNSPSYLAWLERQSAAYRAKQEANDPDAIAQAAILSGSMQQQLQVQPAVAVLQQESLRLSALEGVVRGYKEAYAANPSAASDIPLVTPALMIGISTDVELITGINPASGQAISVQEVSKTLPSGASTFQTILASGAGSIVPADMNAILAQFGSLFAVALVYQTTAQVGISGANNKKAIDLSFALAYAGNVMKLVNNKVFDQIIARALIHSNPENKAIQEERVRNQMIAVIKSCLIASAIALLYKVETGWITDLEFMAMLNGEMEYKRKDRLRPILIGLLQQQLAILGPDAEKFKKALFKYMSTNPKVEDMSDPAAVLAGVGKYHDLNRPITD